MRSGVRGDGVRREKRKAGDRWQKEGRKRTKTAVNSACVSKRVSGAGPNEAAPDARAIGARR